MYAIVEIAGQQFKIEKGQKIFVHRLKAEEGSKVNFDRVMLLDDNGSVKVGAPTVEGVGVTATVMRHLKGEKVLVFKKKRRKSYQKMNGHRQFFTQILIDEIGGAKAAPKAAKPKEKVEEPKDSAPVETTVE